MRLHRYSMSMFFVLMFLPLGLCTSRAGEMPLQLHPLFGEHAVLQAGKPIPMWGTAAPGATVTVTLNGQSASGKAAADGRWMTRLAAQNSGGPHELSVTAGTNVLAVKDVLIGEVWLCSGQSNMERGLDNAEAPKADFPQMRAFRVDSIVCGAPRSTCGGQWQVCSPQTAGGISAVAYFFGRDVHRARKVPVGLIISTVSGSPAQAWVSPAGFDPYPELRLYREEWENRKTTFRAYVTNAIGAYMEKIDKVRKEVCEVIDKDAPFAAFQSPLPEWYLYMGGLPCVNYNGMIAPLVPYALRGVIWYQGESNIDLGYQYRVLLPALIRSWRDAWGQGDLPFLYVQLARVWAIKKEPSESKVAELREAQLMTLALTNTAMAVFIDDGLVNNFHPRKIHLPGPRLALAARARVYGEPIEFSGPLYAKMTVEDGKISIHFTHVGGGLVAQGNEPLQWFAIAGEDRKFFWAKTRIEGPTIVVWHEQVPKPAAVRYAWADNPEGCNLFNKEGLPASPFRTDDWPALTRDKHHP